MHRLAASCLGLLLLVIGASTGIAGASHGGAHGITTVEGEPDSSGGTAVSFPTGTVEITAGFRSELAIVSEPDRTVGTRRPVGCFYFVVIDTEPHIETFGRAEALTLHEQRTNTDNPIGIHCFFIDTRAAIAGYPRVWDPTPTPGAQPPLIDLVELEIWARNQLTFTPPTPQLSPAGDQFVGIASWLAITSELDYAPISAQAGPIWITATPVFRNVTWDMGNGDQVTCTDDVAAVWHPDRPDQTSTCTYVYESNGAGAVVETEITATATWTILTVTSDDPEGAAPRPSGTVSRSTTFTTDVRELQAVID